MIIRFSSVAACQQKLVEVNAKIDRHVLNSPRIKAAREVLSEHRDHGKQAVTRALSDRGLPTPAQQGRALLFGLTSLARLNRKRIRLETRIAQLETTR